MKNKIWWLIFRCLVVGLSAVLMPPIFSDPQFVIPDFPFWGVLFILVGGTISILSLYKDLIKKEQQRNRLRNWSRPSWFTNPFSGQIHFFHMAGNAVLIAGLVGLLQSALSGKVALINLFTLTAGWSIIISNVAFYEFIFKSSDFEDEAS